MEYLLTNTQMRNADTYTINKLGVPSLTLMERAGEALCTLAQKLAPTGKIACICGGGNNGGDGFVCARLLRRAGREVDVVFFAEKTSNDCKIHLEKYRLDGGEILETLPIENEYALLVDCLFGTGFHGELASRYLMETEKINGFFENGGLVLAADIPSGVNGDNGYAAKGAVRATHTLCIGEKKAGAFLGDGIDCAGEVLRADIGIALPKGESYGQIIDDAEIKTLVKRRKRNVHKGSFGRAAIVAGGLKYTGAAALSVGACLRSGAGYTTLFTPSDLLPYYIWKYPEALLESLCEGGRVAFNEESFEKLLSYDSIAYGMGMGESEDTAKGALWLLERYTGKLILDADALNSLAKYVDEANRKTAFATKKCDVILTPHVKEFSRLSKESVQNVLEKGLQAPVAFAKEYKVSVLLKNAVSVLTDGERIVINPVGTAGQAKGGSGDVLSGVIAGLCASGLSAFDGGKAGAYLTGRAAQIAAEETGEYSLLATDVIGALGKAFLSVLR